MYVLNCDNWFVELTVFVDYITYNKTEIIMLIFAYIDTNRFIESSARAPSIGIFDAQK